ncbi:MAG: alpha/beta fold hydrolase, partial [Actinomycetes bacterium]
RATTSGMRAQVKYGWPDTDLSFTLVRAAFGAVADPDDVADVRQMISEFPAESATEAGASIAHHDVREDLRHVDVPTVVLVGDADRLTPPAHARLVRDCVPGAELVVLPRIGHQVMQEAPLALREVLRRLVPSD